MMRIGIVFCASAGLLLPVPATGRAADPAGADHLSESAPPIAGMPTEAGLEESFRLVRESLRASPEFAGQDAGTHFRLAEVLAHRGDVNGAKEEYRTAIRLQPDFGRAYRGLGQVLLDHHEYAEAVQALRTSVRLARPDGEAMYWLGRAQMGVANLPEAEVALNEAARLKPEDAEAFVDLALVQMAQGKVEPARQAIERALTLRPDGADTHRLMELLQTHAGDPSGMRRAAHALLRGIFARE